MDTDEVHTLKVIKKKKKIKPLLVPSSPRITFMADIICSAAGGDNEVA